MHASLCSYYKIRIVISKTLTGTCAGNVKNIKKNYAVMLRLVSDIIPMLILYS